MHIPNKLSVFKWDRGGALIEGVDEATVGLLDEHKLSIEALGARYCTDLNPDRPEQSRGVQQERAAQVCVSSLSLSQHTFTLSISRSLHERVVLL